MLFRREKCMKTLHLPIRRHQDTNSTKICTCIWYWQYQGVVLCVPQRGREATTTWYSRWMHGQEMADVWLREVDYLDVMGEGKPLGVAVAGEEVEDPLLLCGREQPFASVVAVIRAVAAEVRLHLIAQGREVFLFHLAKERGEAISRLDGAYRLEMAARPIAIGGGKDGGAPCAVFRHMLPRGIA